MYYQFYLLCTNKDYYYYNDIFTTIGRANGAMLILFDIFIFDTINQDNAFLFFKKM